MANAGGNGCDVIENIFKIFLCGFTDKLIIELTMLIGYYQMTVSLARALGIELEAQSILSLQQLLGGDGDQTESLT